MSTLTVQNIQGSSSSSNTINVASGHKITGAAGSIVAPGHIIQVVVDDPLSSNVSTTSGSFVDTGLSVNITPSSTSSKILILSTSIVLNNTNNCGVELKVVRDSTDIWIGRGAAQDGLVNWIASGYGAQSCTINTIDSPSSTSSTTYKLQYAEEFGGTAFIYTGATFMAMEIAQ